MDLATLAGHPKPCQEAGHESVRYQCYAVLAGRLKDASLCDDIPPSSDEIPWLKIRIDDREGWVQEDEDLMALGLFPVG